MIPTLTLYRKRFIPNEITCLKDDRILYSDSDLIITSWNCLKPRMDISRGVSAYFLSKGFKVNKVYNSNDQLVYWYCDIIQHKYNQIKDQLIVTDLLLDILVYPDGTVKLLDLDELAECLEEGLISPKLASRSMRTANTLLTEIENGTFHTYQTLIEKFECLST